MSEICDAEVRGGGNCILEKEHKGYHCSVGFICEGCGKTYRGQPYKEDEVIIFGEIDDIFRFCFPCVKQAEREEFKYPPYYD